MGPELRRDPEIKPMSELVNNFYLAIICDGFNSGPVGIRDPSELGTNIFSFSSRNVANIQIKTLTSHSIVNEPFAKFILHEERNRSRVFKFL